MFCFRHFHLTKGLKRITVYPKMTILLELFNYLTLSRILDTDLSTDWSIVAFRYFYMIKLFYSNESQVCILRPFIYVVVVQLNKCIFMIYLMVYDN